MKARFSFDDLAVVLASKGSQKRIEEIRELYSASGLNLE
jgi:hypothetical protein